METVFLHYMDFIKIDDAMVRILILDVSGLYTHIYDEFWCYESEVEERTREFSSPDYICVRVE